MKGCIAERCEVLKISEGSWYEDARSRSAWYDLYTTCLYQQQLSNRVIKSVVRKKMCPLKYMEDSSEGRVTKLSTND